MVTNLYFNNYFMDQNNAQEALYKAIKTTGKNTFIGGIMFVVVFLILDAGMIISLTDPNSKSDKGFSLAIFIILLLFTLLALSVIAKGFKMLNPESSNLIRALNENPERIVWVYKKVSTTTYKAYGVLTVGKTRKESLMIGYVDQKLPEEITTNSNDIEGIMTYLQKKLPKATFGYTKELLAQFSKKPNLLLKNNG